MMILRNIHNSDCLRFATMLFIFMIIYSMSLPLLQANQTTTKFQTKNVLFWLMLYSLVVTTLWVYSLWLTFLVVSSYITLFRYAATTNKRTDHRLPCTAHGSWPLPSTGTSAYDQRTLQEKYLHTLEQFVTQSARNRRKMTPTDYQQYLVFVINQLNSIPTNFFLFWIL